MQAEFKPAFRDQVFYFMQPVKVPGRQDLFGVGDLFFQPDDGFEDGSFVSGARGDKKRHLHFFIVPAKFCFRKSHGVEFHVTRDHHPFF